MSNLPQFKFFAMSERFYKIPFVSISATSVTQYYRTLDSVTMKFLAPTKKNEFGIEEKIKPPVFSKHRGVLSEKGRRNLNRSINNFLLSVDSDILINGKGKDNIAFVTLTLPSSQIKSYSMHHIKHYHSDKEIKSKCFNQFLTEIKENQGVKNFVWVAEKQINGNIHFHLLIDKNINSIYIRHLWNRIINKLGYVDRYAKKMRKLSFDDYKRLRSKENKSDEQLLKAYQYGVNTDWLQPNSTDIARLKKVQNIGAYISKYMTKGFGHSDNQIKKHIAELSAKYDLSDIAVKMMYTIEGRIWQCSRSVSRSRRCVDFLSDNYTKELSNVIKNEEKTKKDEVKIFQEEHFTTVLFHYKTFRNKMHTLFKTFMEHIKECFTNSLDTVVNVVTSSVCDVGCDSPTLSASVISQLKLNFNT